ncbi:WD40-repeat-containing domain protein [Elsinoe ampelina]|uniref:WD40-repeat-containing domain protein n=1 Tax=Elsinoe ampelina TaxID=302913 RepID=A0A6A6GGT4_9PEZI|nr:WD40-repeat-containing domain protein [Elsinoe ampelina]
MSGPQRDSDLAGLVKSLSDVERFKVFSQLTDSLAAEHKADVIKNALESLPTSAIAHIFEAMRYRLHINPADKLPAELNELIMMNLGALDVVHCSMTSRKWRMMALDTPLWKALFLREGWMVDLDAIQARLKLDNRISDDSLRSHRRKFDASADARKSRKRQRDASSSRQASDDVRDTQTWNEQHGRPETDDDNQMEGVESSTVGRSTLADMEDLASLSPASSGSRTPYDGPPLQEDNLEAHRSNYELNPPLTPPVTVGLPGHKSINWHYLYKQRRKLESNWNEGRYKNFQLPHPSYPDEMHEECVYTIQFVKNYLVSGSRDKSIKIWNLDTLRCERTLDKQHEQSVLCLQFDPDPSEDIVVSGGSDSYVVIWKFSTGEVVHKMTTAHRESVLNLRFDSRYLITCSKDKTIKIWNRRKLRSDDPIVPNMAHQQFPPDAKVDLEPFSLLSSLRGHGAAVNAIQIYEDTIVSASGDRTIRMWNIKTGECIREINGHVKGIACVQFDGRRVVSGSSDNTVRIFDASTKGEVACLHGHSNLVRTLQARFGDRQVTDDELEALARQTQDRMLRQVDDMHNRAGTSLARNGLDTMSNLRSLNAKIPHGGGGSRWSRIVSGSYDETVIIWKKDSDGKWIASRRLHQDEVLALQRHRNNRQQRGPVPPGGGHGHANAGQHQQPAQQAAPQGGGAANQQQNQAQGRAQGQVQNQGQAAAGGMGGQPPPVHVHPRLQQGQHVHHHHHHVPQAGHAGNVAIHAQQIAQQRQLLQHQNLQQQQHGMRRMNQGAEESSNRVFKLQFDTRRIVCCSQNKVIVGWDFANGDEDLIEASKFFTETD